MKRLSVLLCLVMVLSLLCPAGALGEVVEPTEHSCDIHYALCTNPDVCINCSYEGETQIQHTGGTEYQQKDEWTHLLVCTGCSETLQEENHYADVCNQPCQRCGYEKVSNYAAHSGNQHYVINGDQHDLVCSDCGNVLGSGPHTITCATHNKCEYCGYESEMEPQHTGGTEYRQKDETTHLLVCTDCGETLQEENHYANVCNQPCLLCGYEKAVDYSSHSGNQHYVINGDRHDLVCSDCGAVFGSYSHSTTCANRNKCEVCGYEGEMETQHTGKDYQQKDETTHVLVCTGCGETLLEEKHSTYACNEPCRWCGYEKVLNFSIHADEGHYVINGDRHDLVCGDCGGVIESYMHSTTCLNPNKCQDCDYEGEISYVYHDNEDIVITDETHGYYCADCHRERDVYTHYAFCTTPNSCDICGYEGEISEVYHVETVFVANEDGHEMTCTACNETYGFDEHFAPCDAPTKCTACGWEGEISSLVHHWSFDECIDEKLHGDRCESCNAVRETSEHQAICTDPNRCAKCGYEGEIGRSFHKDGGTFTDLGSTHRFQCDACGETWEGEHLGFCIRDGACTFCGSKNIPKINHFWGQGADCHDPETHEMICVECGEHFTDFRENDIVEPICTSDSYQSFTCAYCEQTVKKTLPAPGHDWAQATRKDATCTESGSIVSECKRCGEQSVEELPALGHEWKQTSHTDATCTAAGSTISECTRCGEQSVKEIAALGHEWKQTSHSDATCTAAGSTVSECTRCGEQSVEELPALGHEWKQTSHSDATCTAAGSTVSECTRCGEQSVKEVGALGHEWKQTSHSDATCTAPGSTVSECTRCGEQSVKEVGALGHEWKQTSHSDATCTAAGSTVSECTRCGEQSAKELPALGHEWKQTSHSDATCTEPGSTVSECTRCGEQSAKKIDALGHEWKQTSHSDATCTAAGSTVSECTRCGEQSVKEVGALGHAFGKVYTSQSDGTHAVFCDRCGEKHAVSCSMATTEIGNMICSACPICGYTEYTMQSSALEAQPGMESVVVNHTLERVENAKFEWVATEDGASARNDDLTLVVQKMALEIQSELPDTVQANVRAVLAVTLLSGAQIVQPDGRIRLCIPCEEAQLEGMKLLLLTEEGKLIELEYEILDGELVFETDRIGAFLIVEDTAEEI